MNSGAIYCGKKLAKISNVSGLSCQSKVDAKFFAGTIGCLLKPSGLVEKAITIENHLILPRGSTRNDIERLMNEFNEFIALNPVGTLNIYDVNITNCIPLSINYENKVINNLLSFSIKFEITEQNYKQYAIEGLVSYPGRREGSFIATDIDNAKPFVFMQNCDMTRDCEFKLVKNTVVNSSDIKGTMSGGVEHPRVYCWCTFENGYSGRKNGVSYMMNMMNSYVGRIGTFTLGTNTITNCAITDINMKALGASTMEYDVTLLASLQC